MTNYAVGHNMLAGGRSMIREFTVTVPRTPRTYAFKQGWGVHVLPIWSGEDDERISDIEVEVVEIAEDRVEVIGEVPCVKGPFEFWVPVENFLDVPDLWEDDTHDLRSRWFADRDVAEMWAASVQSLWEHPAPWTAFVRMS